MTCTVEGDTTELDLDTATPFGLIVSEALANAFKYAFSPQRALERNEAVGFIHRPSTQTTIAASSRP